MKYLWILFLAIPTVARAQSQQENEGYLYQKLPVQFFDPDGKKYDYLEQQTILEESKPQFKCDPPEKVVFLEPDEHGMYPQFNSVSHFNPEPGCKREKREISVEYPQANGDICTFVAYPCDDHKGSLQWTDDLIDLFDGRLERDISPEQIRNLYCLRKENCNPHE